VNGDHASAAAARCAATICRMRARIVSIRLR
jgi:hypothetical protein